MVHKQTTNSPTPPAPITSGVVKLGFSWMGCDVTKWEGLEGLAHKLLYIFGRNAGHSERYGKNQGGQIGTSCIVQELVIFGFFFFSLLRNQLLHDAARWKTSVFVGKGFGGGGMLLRSNRCARWVLLCRWVLLLLGSIMHCTSVDGFYYASTRSVVVLSALLLMCREL